MSALFGQSNTGEQALRAGTQPEWFQNQKKRTIPNHLAPKKKTGFHINPSSTSKPASTPGSRRVTSTSFSKEAPQSLVASKDQFNILSFGQQQPQPRKAISAGSIYDRNGSIDTLFDSSTVDSVRYDDTITETNEDFGSEDLPPTRSIFDLNDEVLVSLNKPAQQIDSFITKDPKQFTNVFNRSSTQNDSSANPSTQEKRKSINATSNESAVLVFGYPEALATQVLQYFKDFGHVLEDFESSIHNYTLVNTTSKQALVPIFCGKNWVKITYDNPASALDALQENGSVFNGVLLGVIPYTKHAIEKLQKRKLEVNEDIGGNGDISLLGSSKVDNTAPKVPDDGAAPTDSATSYINRLDIKDGSQFFLKSEDQSKTHGNINEKPLGFFGTLSNFVFGFHEL